MVLVLAGGVLGTKPGLLGLKEERQGRGDSRPFLFLFLPFGSCVNLDKPLSLPWPQFSQEEVGLVESLRAFPFLRFEGKKKGSEDTPYPLT
jgi:hypothetical protein